ncbi:hypothetical protein QYG89_05555 [Bacillus sp. B190/17]|uniref:Uncharacterized protein n=1 Tax=Bacillus lumedeiriae TaxID=3058829 RepID=A0ABW8I6P7_9BACI
MEKLIDELIADYKMETQDTEGNFLIEKLEYDISFLVKVANNCKKWSAKDIMVAEDDQEEIIRKISELTERYVEDFKTEDRDPEFLYKYNTAGLLVYSNMIQNYFADIAYEEPLLHSNQVKKENPDMHVGLVIENYEGNAYPPSDEMNLIVHR